MDIVSPEVRSRRPPQREVPTVASGNSGRVIIGWYTDREGRKRPITVKA
jgi:hypothetical protein